MIVEHLIADKFGCHVGKYSKRLKVTQGKTVLAEAPLMHLQTVTINSRGVSLSSDAIEACCEQGIPIIFLSGYGNPYASLYASGLVGTVITRREQLLAYYDNRGIHIALAIAGGKLSNQEATLKYLAKNRRESAPETYEVLNDAAAAIRDNRAALDHLDPNQHIDEIRGQIMGIEGRAGYNYWQAVSTLLPDHYAWPGRGGRGATDPINSLLNYGYGILYGRIEQSIILAGLDPYAGFLHADRAGKPSLVLDLIEEFRQIVIDRLVIGLAARHFKVEQLDNGKLRDDVRTTYAEKVIAHLESTTRYMGKRYPLRFIIQNQTRHLAAYLRGQVQCYEPFSATW